MVNPYSRDNRCRPNFPEIVREALEEEKKSEDEGIWRTIVRKDEELQEKLREKEEKFMKKQRSETKSLEETLFQEQDDSVLEKTVDDLI